MAYVSELVNLVVESELVNLVRQIHMVRNGAKFYQMSFRLGYLVL